VLFSADDGGRGSQSFARERDGERQISTPGLLDSPPKLDGDILRPEIGQFFVVRIVVSFGSPADGGGLGRGEISCVVMGRARNSDIGKADGMKLTVSSQRFSLARFGEHHVLAFSASPTVCGGTTASLTTYPVYIFNLYRAFGEPVVELVPRTAVFCNQADEEREENAPSSQGCAERKPRR